MNRPPAPRTTRLLHIDPLAPWRRLFAGAGAFFVLLAFGSIGYMLIEGWSFLDALYMTVTTVTTVGFREVEPLSDGGQVFTIFVVLFGVGVALYILTTVVQAVVEGELALALGVRRMQARIGALRNHYILCGFGRVGEEIARDLADRGVPLVVIESNPEALQRSEQFDYLIIEGDATQDAILQRAGIERARALLAASDSDAGNTYITLTAKALNPGLYVVARVGHPASEARVRRAGADRVISPYSLAGRRMALSALQPLMVDFIDVLASGRQAEQILAELVVLEESAIVGRPLQDALNGCPVTTLLAIQHADGEVLVGPAGSYTLRPGDRLMLLSSEADMEELGRARDQAGLQP
ncbi:MAG: potassium channel protein [Dehalococcoidia bacterium]